MADELIDIYDLDMNLIGQAMKSQALKEGLWHKVFHCWIVSGDKVWLQLRGKDKDLQPNTLDASVGGHIKAGETAKYSGVRETKEELGMKVAEEQFNKMFVFPFVEDLDGILNNAFANVYLLKTDKRLEDLVMQPEEVDGVFAANYNDLHNLFTAATSEISIEGLVREEKGYKTEQRKVGIEDFFKHNPEYFAKTFATIKRNLEN